MLALEVEYTKEKLKRKKQYKTIYLTRRFSKVNNDHGSKFSSLSNWKEEGRKNRGFNGIRTRGLRDAVRCSTNWAMKPRIGSEVRLLSIALVSRRSWVRIPLKSWFFQASSVQLHNLENLLRWSFFSFIYHRSSHMNYFIYSSRQRNFHQLTS